MTRTVFRSLLCVSLLASMAHAAIPLINSATVNYANNALTISGTGFGSNPKVTLGGAALTVQPQATATQIVATFPSSASSFAPGSYVLTVVFSNQLPAIFLVALGAPESDVATLQQQVAALQAAVTTLQASNSQLQAALSAVLSNSVLALNGHLTFDGTTAQFSGVNVQIVNGLGNTATLNGTGNLIIGYNEPWIQNPQQRTVCSDGAYQDPASCTAAGQVYGVGQRTGSHNLVIGESNSYGQYGGMVIGYYNTINRAYATVSGGIFNIASGRFSSVSGGNGNTASGDLSSVSGGNGNTASGNFSSVSGGLTRVAPNPYNWAAGTLLEPN